MYRFIIRLIRLLYYLPMERMGTQEKLDRLEINYDYLKEENEKLEEENKKLKEEINTLRIELIQEKWKTGKKWTPATPYI